MDKNNTNFDFLGRLENVPPNPKFSESIFLHHGESFFPMETRQGSQVWRGHSCNVPYKSGMGGMTWKKVWEVITKPGKRVHQDLPTFVLYLRPFRIPEN